MYRLTVYVEGYSRSPETPSDVAPAQSELGRGTILTLIVEILDPHSRHRESLFDKSVAIVLSASSHMILMSEYLQKPVSRDRPVLESSLAARWGDRYRYYYCSPWPQNAMQFAHDQSILRDVLKHVPCDRQVHAPRR